MTIAEALREGESYLAERGIETPRVDAELLLEKTLGLARTELYADGGRPVEGDRLDEFRALLGRRGRHEPAAYVLGEWGFRGLTLRIDPRVLIPRPETEVVVERCLALLDGIPDPEVLDVGTGSGAIALAIADEHPRAHVTAFDNSLGALEVARENSETTGLGDRVRLVEHDLTSGFGSRCFDLIVSNPPYVAPDEIESLQPEVRDWEPREALVGAGLADAIAAEAIGALKPGGALVGAGLADAIAAEAIGALKPGGALVLEVALGQAQDVAERLPRLGYEGVKVTRDLSGVERVVEGRR